MKELQKKGILKHQLVLNNSQNFTSFPDIIITKRFVLYFINIFTEIKLVVINHQAATDNIYNYLMSSFNIFKNKLKFSVQK